MELKRAAFGATAAVLGTAVALLLAEALLRILGIGYGNAPLEPDPLLHHRHPAGYVYLVHIPGGEYGGHYVRYDAEGYRVLAEGAATREARHRIAVMGDSFVEATQVSHEKTFVGLMDAAGGGESLSRNYGVASYSPVLYRLQWDKAVKPFRPTHVFLFLYSNDIGNDKAYRKDARVSEGGAVLGVPGPGNGAVQRLLRCSYLLRYLRKVQLQVQWIRENRGKKTAGVVGGLVEEEPAMELLTEEALKGLSEAVKASGARFVLSAIPSKYRLFQDVRPAGKEFSDNVKVWAAANSIEFLDLVPEFCSAADPKNLFFKNDIHLNENGHRAVFEAVRKGYPDLFVSAGAS